MARCFLAHLRAHLPGIEVPATGMIPCGVRPTPYIYSEAADRGPDEGGQRAQTGRIIAASHLRHIDRFTCKLRSPPRRSGPLVRCRC